MRGTTTPMPTSRPLEKAPHLPALVGVVEEQLVLSLDGVLTVSDRIPRGCAPRPVPGGEFGAMLLEEHADVLGAVDLADAPQLVTRKVPDLDGRLHR